MKIKSFAIPMTALMLFLFHPGRITAGVQHYSLNVCRDGRTLELKMESGENTPEKTVRFSCYDNPSQIANKISATGLFEKRLWVYFHCMWGNNRTFHQLTLHHIDQIVDNGQDNIVLSVIWPANQIGYRRNWKKATAKGQRLANFFSCVAQYQKTTVNILSHSMGNRVFQGLWQKAGDQLKFENVVLAAPDLDTDIFENDFRNLPAHAKRIIVVQHHNDRLLLASALMLHRKRLGRTRHISSRPANLTVIDATAHHSSRWVDMSNHLHFILAEAVRHQLRELVR